MQLWPVTDDVFVGKQPAELKEAQHEARLLKKKRQMQMAANVNRNVRVFLLKKSVFAFVYSEMVCALITAF